MYKAHVRKILVLEEASVQKIMIQLKTKTEQITAAGESADEKGKLKKEERERRDNQAESGRDWNDEEAGDKAVVAEQGGKVEKFDGVKEKRFLRS